MYTSTRCNKTKNPNKNYNLKNLFLLKILYYYIYI